LLTAQDAPSTSTQVRQLQGKILPPFSRFCPKYGKENSFKILKYIKVYGVIPQKKDIFVVTAVRASNVT
jgi:hypothetical protein